MHAGLVDQDMGHFAKAVGNVLNAAHAADLAGVGRIGRTSYVASTGLFRDGECIGVCDTVLVLLGDDGPTPLPDGLRTALQTLLLGTPKST